MEGLFRRGGVWWARLVVPLHLRAAAGRREFVRSTGSRERSVGKLVASVLLADWRRQLFELERGRVDDVKILTLIDGNPTLGGSGFVTLQQAAALSGLDVDDFLREAEAGALSLGCRVPLHEGSGFAVDVAKLDRGGPEEGYVVPNNPPLGAINVDLGGQVLRLYDGGADIAQEIRGGLAEVALVMLEYQWGQKRWAFVPDAVLTVQAAELAVRAADIEVIRALYAAKVPPERVERARRELAQRATPSRGTASGGWTQKLFSEALAAFCTDQDGLAGRIESSHEIRQRKGQMMAFAELMGDVRLGEIDGEFLRAYRDGPLKTIPGSMNKLPKDLSRSTIKETIEALRVAGRDWPVLSDGMRQERMSHLGMFFDWLDRKGYLKPNPAAGLRGETGMTKAERKERRRKSDDDENGRRPFNNEELQLIFGQQHFKSGNGLDVDWGAGEWYPFQYWLPLLGLYGGVRIKEGSQLHLSDVRQVGGVWVLDINETTKDKSLKNQQSRRQIPVHPELERLGFLLYCDRLRADGFMRVFPELTWAETPAKYAKESGRRMSAMLHDLGMPRDGSLVFHSLRHNCNNALLRVPKDDLPGGEHILKFLAMRTLGHAVDEDTNEKYYTAVTLQEQATALARVRFELPSIAPFDVESGLNCIRVAMGRKLGARRGKEDMGPLGQNSPRLTALSRDEARRLSVEANTGA